jgi:cytochrome c5
VDGFIAVPIKTPDETKEIALPHASVFLVPFDDRTNPVASTLSDLSGRFSLKTDQTGLFALCVEADGFQSFCSEEVFSLDKESKASADLSMPIDPNASSIIAYGEVTLFDGSHPRGFEPFMGVNTYPEIELNTSASRLYKGYVNNLGEYIIPEVPIKDDFNLTVTVDNETRELDIETETELQGNRAYRFDIVLPNSAPRIRLMSASINGKPIQVAVPGSAVTLTAVTDDPDADQLEYRWLLPDGQIVGPTNDPELKWTVPTREGSYTITVLVSDNRGGYISDALSVTATSRGVPFSGTVVEASGAAISGAQIDVNGRLTNTNNMGWFSYEVPVDDKYVFTIRKPSVNAPNQAAYGTVSFVYTGPIAGGRWVLNRAQVTTVHNPNLGFSLDHKRDQKDCIGSQSSKIDWQPYLQPGLFEWQDGRGNALSLGELGQSDPEAVEGVMRLLSRIEFDLPRKLAELTQIEPVIDDNRVQCLGGIRVEIPPGALENPTTHQAPTGDVQVALSTVDLTAGDQMPGDYTAIDANGQFLSMETFGAGSIEIGAGNERFNLKPGMTATVTIPVDATQLAGNATLSPTIPFLYYDEQNGVWRQDGDAILTGSGANAAYVMTVKHFSTMNADILKSGQSCIAVEVDPLANFTLPFNVEVTMPPSVVNPNVTQVRTLTVDSLKSNVIFNLPNDTNIVLTPIIQGVKPDGSTGNIPAGVFVVNTGGPMNSSVNPPAKNPDGTYYAEVNGQPTGPCGSRVTLKKLNGPTLAPGFEFLQGFYFEASNIDEFASNVQANIIQGATDYYQQIDQRGLRASFNLFKQKNKFGQPLNTTEVEWDAQYANSGDLGFGRDMHCRRNVADDGKFDIACYVTNYGQPPPDGADQVDADNALAHDLISQGATVAMEYSRIENPSGDPNEFFNNDRAVKFYVYDTKNPNAAPLKQANLDSFGNRPVPQLCVICHGGQVAGIAADPSNPTGPQKGAFANRNDIINMKSNFLPFDLHLFSYPTSKDKTSQQAAFKGLNVDIVKEVAKGNGVKGAAIVELIDTLYGGGSATQLEDAVITNWDAAIPTSNPHRFYRDVFARTCRTCHVAQPFTAPVFTNKTDFENQIANVQTRVCSEKVMPHAKRTNDIFWTSLGPNMPAFLQLYGQTLPGWISLDSAQCGLFVQPGNTLPSLFASQIYPILTNPTVRCVNCHAAVGNAKFVIGNIANTYASLLNAVANDGTSKYIVPNNPSASLLYQRITHDPSRMPLGGPNLETTDNDSPPDGVNDATEILNWINAGAPGP